MKTIFTLLLCFVFHFSYSQSKIMDCSIEQKNVNSDLYVFLTDTLSVTGVEVKVGTEFDGSDLYNHSYTNSTLPADASLDYNTLYLPMGTLNSNDEKYVWVKVLLSNGGFHEIKITSSN